MICTFAPAEQLMPLNPHQEGVIMQVFFTFNFF